jgi:hypothetical protein
LSKTAKICPKTISSRNFEIPPKIEILVSFQKKTSMRREGTKSCAYQFSLWMWISTYPFVQNNNFFKVPYVSWVWDFANMYLTNLETRLWSPSIHTYSLKWIFWPPKLWCTPRTHGIFFNIFNFEPYGLVNGMEWMCKIWWTSKRGCFDVALGSTRPQVQRSLRYLGVKHHTNSYSNLHSRPLKQHSMHSLS